MKSSIRHILDKVACRSALLALLMPLSLSAPAATTDLANGPLANSTTATVRPNIMFILDDSGSMGWDYLPDNADNFKGDYGFASSQCNAVYYNPNITYQLPVDSSGTNYPNSSFTNAKRDGFNSSSSSVDLSTSFKAYSTDTEQAAYYYKYTGSQTTKNYTSTSSTFYKECNSNIGDNPGKNVFTKVTVSSTSGPGSTDERQNFANWYTYYRTRMQLMKSAASQAFKNLDDTYRIGLTTINNTNFSSNSSTEFLNISDFNTSHKSDWYTKLFSISATSSTPLRKALADTGRLYAGKHSGITDPVQYSCQQNFAILASDGYWNGSAGYKEDGATAVGDQDGASGVSCPSCDLGTYGSSSSSYNGKTSNGLADVAYYYYHTDLRPSMDNNVKKAGTNTNVDDVAEHQHMTTFTLGLGLNGLLTYAEDYKAGASTDYNNIVQGTLAWPNALADTPSAIDDLWHAAVNGRGTYFSAQDPQALASGLGKALAGIQATVGAAAAAATSNLQPVAGDNYAYIANYRTANWDGNVEAHTIDLSTGAVSATASWSAQSLLDNATSATADSRTIYTFDSTAASKLKSFTWGNLTATEKTYFNASSLTQYASWNATQIANGTGTQMINYLRGQTGYENKSTNAADNRLFRSREHVLGDIVHSQPVYVKKPPFGYGDADYAAFVTANSSRQAMVYVGGNDGMLHAFNADTGAEVWAYIPPTVMPNLWKLADENYTNHHQFFVDGSPIVGDAYIGGSWKTILVGGLNKGGRGYYALDITNPASPKALWNFTVTEDSDLGYTYGLPIITKRPSDGKWVVLVTSGYNNVSSGTGGGFLYVLDAATGSVLNKIATGAGSTTTPSGLAQITGYASNANLDNTTTVAYGGDLLGNLWRFDLAANTKTAMAQLGTGANAQPVTTKPELGLVNGKLMVYVGTGQYLGTTDLTSTQQQSLYALKDDGTALGNVRGGSSLVQQTISNLTTTTRTTTANTVDLNSKYGWYVDFPDTAERINVDPKLQLGVLTVATTVPTSDACNPSGYSWLYFFDYKTGSFVTTSANNLVGQRLNSLVVGLNIVDLGGGKIKTIVTLDKNLHETYGNPTNPSSVNAKRVTWRELIQE